MSNHTPPGAWRQIVSLAPGTLAPALFDSLATVWLVRQLTGADYGQLVVALAICVPATIAVLAWFDAIVVRHLPGLSGSARQSTLAALWWLLGGAAAAVLLVTLGVMLWRPARIDPALVLATGANTGTAIVYACFTSLLVATGRGKTYSAAQLAISALKWLGPMACVLLLGASPAAALHGMVAGRLLVVAGLWPLVRPTAVPGAELRRRLGPLLRYGLPFLGLGLAGNLLWSLDRLLLASRVPAAELGQYGALAGVTCAIGLGVALPGTFWLGPELMRRHAESPAAFDALYRRGWQVGLLLTAGATLAAALAAPGLARLANAGGVPAYCVPLLIGALGLGEVATALRRRLELAGLGRRALLAILPALACAALVVTAGAGVLGASAGAWGILAGCGVNLALTAGLARRLGPAAGRAQKKA